MRTTLAHGVIAFCCLTCGFAWAANPVPSSDPLAAIDLNRNAIIADIVQGFDGDRAALAKRLAGLRADRLLSASLASSRGSLETILNEGEASSDAAARRASAKVLGAAATDLVYTPLTPCRLIDTRGFGAPIQGGAFAPNARRSYVPNGLCSLPTTGVASILVSFTTENLTPSSGGYLAIVAPAAIVTTSVDIFNLGSEWSASNTAVNTGPAAQFDVFVAAANAHVVIDVLGYFAPATFGNITLVTPSTAAAGNIMKGANPFIHNAGNLNTFIGENAGNFTMLGGNNTGSGASALQGNTTGSNNTAAGFNALAGNTTGNFNTAVGVAALNANTIGNTNTATGQAALLSNISGVSNTADGVFALHLNTTGNLNTASGVGALGVNTTGTANTAVGLSALTANTTGGNNIALGYNAGLFLTTGNFNIDIGNTGVAAEAGTTRIGDVNQTRTFISGIRGVTTALAAVPVLVDTNGQLGTVSSSRRVKDDIADMDAASSALMKLRPVTFHYKSDRSRTLQYGLVAEEVADVYPGLVAHSADGKVETVMYQFLPTMLLNEIQKQRHMIEELQQATSEIAELKRQMATLAKLLVEQRTDTASLK